MALITKKDFAEICGMATNALAVYIKRGKVELDGDLIDDENPKNLDFIAKKLGVMRAEKSKATEIIQREIEFDNTEGIPEIRKSEKILKYLDTQKRRKEVEKLEIEIEKKRGELVPVELVSILLAQFSKSVINAFQNAGDNLLVSVGHKKKLTREETAYLKAELVSIINQANDEAVDDSKKSLRNIIEEYSEKRSRGERK